MLLLLLLLLSRESPSSEVTPMNLRLHSNIYSSKRWEVRCPSPLPNSNHCPQETNPSPCFQRRQSPADTGSSFYHLYLYGSRAFSLFCPILKRFTNKCKKVHISHFFITVINKISGDTDTHINLGTWPTTSVQYFLIPSSNGPNKPVWALVGEPFVLSIH